mgnify:FL=1
MPFPLIPVIVVAASILVGGTIIGSIVYHFANADVEVKTANYKDKADVTILFIGEMGAGKDTVIELIKTGKFLNQRNSTGKYELKTISVGIKFNNAFYNNNIGSATTDINYKDKIKIKIINTSGSEHSWEYTEKAKKLSHDIRCYIFDARDFYNVENIKFGIQNTIDECKEKGIKYMSLGTRGDEVDKEKIENEVRSMGMKCSIFELKKEPVEQVIEFLFKEYL